MFEQLWIIIGPAFRFVGIFLEQLELDFLQKIFYLLSNILIFLGILKLLMNRKKKNVLQTKAEKTTNLALYPEGQAEEMLRTIKTYERVIKTMWENIKKVFKWIYGNKQSLISILMSLIFIALAQYALYSDILLQWDFFTQNTLAVKIVGGILTGLFIINLIYTIVTKYGFENLDQIAERLQLKKEEKANQLTKEQKAIVKSQYKTVETELKKAEDSVLKLQKIIDDFTVISGIPGITISDEKRNEYNAAVRDIINAKANVTRLSSQKDTLKLALKK